LTIAQARSFLAFDFGLRRVGVASGNTVTGRGTPLTTVAAEGDARFEAIGRLVAEWRPDALVVGVPFHPDGAAHENTRRARRFARRLQGTRSTSATRRPRRKPQAPATSMPRPRRSSSTNTCKAAHEPTRLADSARPPAHREGLRVSRLHLDAEALYGELKRGVLRSLRPGTVLVGIWSGGAWLAERLQRDLALPGEAGVLSSALHRDDYGSRGLAASSEHTRLPFEVKGGHILLVDDVLYTGRTIRAALNELYDFGRPASVVLAVLVDRGGRELPIDAAVSAARIALPAEQRLSLARDDAGRFSFEIEERT
jgi:pyrimidine operon attenuation protein / uracil phosphoribosyltransferase